MLLNFRNIKQASVIYVTFTASLVACLQAFVTVAERVERQKAFAMTKLIMNEAGKSAGRGGKLRMIGPFRNILVMALLLFAFSACRSKQETDHRPAWVREAEARLQERPTWEASGPGVATKTASSGAESSPSSFFGSGQQATTAPKASGGRTATAPPGMQWSDTQITVEVEE
jgi:hypothetical protein